METLSDLIATTSDCSAAPALSTAPSTLPGVVPWRSSTWKTSRSSGSAPWCGPGHPAGLGGWRLANRGVAVGVVGDCTNGDCGWVGGREDGSKVVWTGLDVDGRDYGRVLEFSRVLDGLQIFRFHACWFGDGHVLEDGWGGAPDFKLILTSPTSTHRSIANILYTSKKWKLSASSWQCSSDRFVISKAIWISISFSRKILVLDRTLQDYPKT